MRRVFVLAICVGCTRVAPPSSPAQLASTPWATAYFRTCGGRDTPAVVSPNGRRLAYCQSLFDLPSGRYLGSTRHNVELFLSDERIVSTNSTDGGLLVGPLQKAVEGTDHQVRGAFVDEVALSPARDRVVATERRWPKESEPSSWVVVRSFPDGRLLDEAPLDERSRDEKVAFLADGRAVVLADRSCVKGSCERNLFLIEDGALQALDERFGGLGTLAATDDGTRAVLTWPDRRELVELPSGKRLAALDAPAFDPEHESAAAAIDARGGRVAYFTAHGLRILDVTSPGRVATLHEDTALQSGELAFSPDGRTLLVRNPAALHVLREGALTTPRLSPEYALELPEGFELVPRDPGDNPELVARYRAERPSTDVVVTASDASEFGPPGLSREQWAGLVLERHGDSDAIAEQRVHFDGSQARAFEYSYFRREGCDPADIYYRFEERGSFLYRIEIELPPGTPEKMLRPTLRAFFDAPRGRDSAHQFAKAPKPSPEPC